MHALIRHGATGAAVAALGLVAGLMSALPASATPATGPAANGTYLALGDSVAFGYVPPEAVPPPNYQDAHSFVGYPEDVAQALRIRVSNASCPGETTDSMLVTGVVSNGCENSLGSSIGYRTQFPLHVQYDGTQMEYALKYLAVHSHTRLVTIDIGANDVFLCQKTTMNGCTSTAEIQTVLQEIQTNLTAIYAQIRDVAHYRGLLVALTYYSLSYAPGQVAGTELLDSAIASVTEKFGGEVADGFVAFEGPSLAAGGSPCAAGLLIKLPDGTCNIHPSPAGHLLLARAIEQVVGALPPK
ncbi:MAG TPA: SGNH/GDSL hydrolase family protein [Streptosporangiaceae bacterium]|nr:SGNH/GDSL hydrolase family protein [Streptosporangiaceae bacterium]